MQRRLARPVISIGNLAAGGRAKTPLAALVAARLRDMGERPAILSRGYARREPSDGVVVVRDPDAMRADLDRSGDEPLMLARQLDGVAVLVSSSRYLAGRLAEHHFNCTVHVLDDGFQHFDLHRDADVVVIGSEDVDRPLTLPFGHLREPLACASAADAIIALDDASGAAMSMPSRGKRPLWRARRRHESPRTVDGNTVTPSAGSVVAVAGIAAPSQFFASLRASGWSVARELPFRDHHQFSRADVRRIFETARTTGAAAVITTEKDVVRLLPFRPFPLAVVTVPLRVEIEEIESFDAWLSERIRA